MNSFSNGPPRWAAVEPPVVVEPSLPEQIEAAVDAAGLGEFKAAITTDAPIVSLADATAAIQAAKDIAKYCQIAGMADKAPGMIRARMSVADARKALADAMKNKTMEEDDPWAKVNAKSKKGAK